MSRLLPRRAILPLALAGLVVVIALLTAPAHAAGRLNYHYQRGYYTDHGWLCYGWPSGAYHCTAHWRRSGGRFISLNPSWVPSQGTVAIPSSTEREPDGDADDPKPASKPVVSDGSAPSGSVRADIAAAFGPYAAQATRVAMCESSLNPNAKSRISSASGVFQFLSSTWAETPYHAYSPFNAYANVQAAAWLFHRDGNSWREWACGYRA